MIIKLIGKKDGEHFGFALFIVFALIAAISLAFVTENGAITGRATADLGQVSYGLMEFDNMNALEILAPGIYYVDGNGVVYLVEEHGSQPIAKVKYFEEIQKGKRIYVDNEGNVGYLIS